MLAHRAQSSKASVLVVLLAPAPALALPGPLASPCPWKVQRASQAVRGRHTVSSSLVQLVAAYSPSPHVVQGVHTVSDIAVQICVRKVPAVAEHCWQGVHSVLKCGSVALLNSPERFHPNGGQFVFVWLPARVPHGARVWRA